MVINMDNEAFKYNYSAKEQEEIRRIREKYLPKEENKMELIRKLDAGATKKGVVSSLILGILSCLVLGAGMSMVMVGGSNLFVLGIVTGLIGLAGMATAYPLYVRITKRERELIAPQILKLTEELMK